MASEIEPRIIKLGHHSILCDAGIAAELTDTLFNPEQLKQQGLLTGQAAGRGDAWFIKYKDRNWVLRHFRRGGLVRHLIIDRYFGWSLENSRSWAEWRLLADLYRRGLPVPRPVAASVRRSCGCYRADLLTVQIPDSMSLAERLVKKTLSEELWKSLGACLRRFHDHGVYHADLNAHNILIDGREQIYLIDFDRGEIRDPGGWARQNLQRLRRSLKKISGTAKNCQFDENHWAWLLQGYDATCR